MVYCPYWNWPVRRQGFISIAEPTLDEVVCDHCDTRPAAELDESLGDEGPRLLRSRAHRVLLETQPCIHPQHLPRDNEEGREVQLHPYIPRIHVRLR